jgi:hypothetical protein
VASIASRANVRDDAYAPPGGHGIGEDKAQISEKRKDNFSAIDAESTDRIERVREISFLTRTISRAKTLMRGIPRRKFRALICPSGKASLSQFKHHEASAGANGFAHSRNRSRQEQKYDAGYFLLKVPGSAHYRLRHCPWASVAERELSSRLHEDGSTA